MPTLTYTDHHGGAPVISWMGREFTSTVPVKVDPDVDGNLIEAAKNNRFFEHKEDESEAPDHDETIVGKGEAAAREGKKRLVPPAYRGEDKKPMAEAWLFGFDRIPPDTNPYREEGETSDAAANESPLIEHSADRSGGPTSVTQVLQNDKEAE